MSVLEATFADGQWDAFAYYKLAEPRLSPSTFKAPTEALSLANQMAKSVPPDTALTEQAAEQARLLTQMNPGAKVSGGQMRTAEELCTTCRKPKHYGPCHKPLGTRPAGDPHKKADFNFGMYGDDPSNGDNPSTSPHYHAATSSISSLARAQDGRPAGEQAATGFADLFRHLGITSLSDDTTPDHLTSNMRKTAYMPGGTSTLTQTIFEGRGSPNPYDERPQALSPPVGWSDEGKQRIQRAFDQIDGAVDSTCIEGNSAPSGGPAV